MKEFFIQCMKDLYSLTGIEQVRWMQNDLKDGKRNFELCVEGMVVKAKEFSYIPEADQKRIILEMMTKDTDYESLNSRTIHKWLSMFKDKYFIDSQAPEETPRVELTKEESARIDALAEEFKSRLIDFRPKYKNLDEEKERIENEDSERVEGRRGLAAGYVANLQQFRCYAKDESFIDIPAKDETYARMSYKEAFGREPERVETKPQ